MERAEVADVLSRWSASDALTLVDAASRDGVLALLASALYAARPEGWTFGFGIAFATAARGVEDSQLRAEARARAADLVGAAEAIRRADAARARADEQRERAERELRTERQSRRESLARAERERDEARRDAAAVAEAVAAAERAASAAEARASHAEARVARLETELAETRRPQSTVDPDAVLAAADDIRGIADRLGSLVSPSPRAVRPKVDAAAPRARPRRVRPPCPPGLIANSRAGLDGMLRTRGVLLVVDGYNVSKTAWSDAPLEEQRERLVAALAELHLRIRCDVIVAFDGADVRGVPLPRKPGVRVVFSAPGETADDVVVREADAPATTIPVVVASSDAEVRTARRGGRGSSGPVVGVAGGAPEMSVTPFCHPASMLTIDCDECVMRHTGACDDCVVTFVVGREPGEALVIDVEEERAVRMLARAGLVPRLRHVAG